MPKCCVSDQNGRVWNNTERLAKLPFGLPFAAFEFKLAVQEPSVHLFSGSKLSQRYLTISTSGSLGPNRGRRFP